MGHLRGGGVYGVRDVADALGVDPHDLALMIRSGEVLSSVWAKALAAEKKLTIDMTNYIRSATEISK